MRLLQDVIESIDHIFSFTAGMSEEQYEADTKTQWAVERAFLIIAEVGYRLKDDIEVLCPGPPWRGIRDLGNVIRHGYEAVLNNRVWNTIQNDLESLRAAVLAAIERLRAIP